MNWKNWPDWAKGGSIGTLGSGIISLLLFFSVFLKGEWSYGYQILFIPLLLTVGVLGGTLMGWLIGKYGKWKGIIIGVILSLILYNWIF